MNDRELYALCYELMADDNPKNQRMQPVNRNCLIRLAERIAEERGFDGWIAWYMQAEMPFTEAEVNENAS